MKHEKFERLIENILTGKDLNKSSTANLCIYENTIKAMFYRILNNRISLRMIDSLCSFFIVTSVNIHFSKHQKMRYMGQTVLINQTLIDSWLWESEQFDDQREKIMFALSRIVDAYNLKKRKESILEIDSNISKSESRFSRIKNIGGNIPLI